MIASVNTGNTVAACKARPNLIETFDPKSDLPFFFSIGDFGALQELALINGTPQSKTLQLEAGRKYRFRFINISTNNQAMQISLRNLSGPVEWVKIARDGADLPARVSTSARETITVGETLDVEFFDSGRTGFDTRFAVTGSETGPAV